MAPPSVDSVATFSFETCSKAGRTLIIGATGFIGGFIADACLASGRPTYILSRSKSTKVGAHKELQDKGAIVLYGKINDRHTMENILKDHKIEMVISAVGGDTLLEQIDLVHAIKAVGSVQRFLPSEFGHDVDRADPVEPGLTMYNEKRKVRRVIEEVGIPYTYICCNSIAAWPYYDNTHPSEVLPPMDQFLIYGDGSVKGTISFATCPAVAVSEINTAMNMSMDSLSTTTPKNVVATLSFCDLSKLHVSPFCLTFSKIFFNLCGNQPHSLSWLNRYFHRKLGENK